MKRLFCLVIILILIGIGISNAGEKEELLLKQSLLKERMSRLSAEWEITKRDLAIIEQKIIEIEKKEVTTPEGKR